MQPKKRQDGYDHNYEAYEIDDSVHGVFPSDCGEQTRATEFRFRPDATSEGLPGLCVSPRADDTRSKTNGKMELSSSDENYLKSRLAALQNAWLFPQIIRANSL
jgi:hypothetical protein